MAFKILISPIANNNIDDAIKYYKLQSQSAAKSFRKKLLDAYKSLQINPFFAVKYKDVRAIPLKKLPYLVLFDVDEKEKIVNILSVFCTHQNPEKYP
ncbi:type II toxin-antitoxin system RelE/ParE family toxin [Chryseobacterium taihuense]|uniref:ParE toxin of type II toxin-antitoxin system, parDE n=1 Tax=Chryseobacterium taihuense TaxID=1141221 RepID=A0ABY0QTG2_9FLAO|nr:type II toxin-antitoxin system RelE/ParE family toxin [Chryseobacterium taihuense]SDL84293.1 ParE toxin of type II toxin-antitoxin system, parDE [Chryseobacterium taihuense]